MEDSVTSLANRNTLPWIFILAISLSACGGGGDNNAATEIEPIKSTAALEPNKAATISDTNPVKSNATQGQTGSQPITTTITGNTNGDGMTVSLSWRSNPDPVDGYVVYNGPTPEEAVSELTVTPQTTVQYDTVTDLGLNSGDRTCFRLRAYSKGGVSGFSDAVCVDITEPLAVSQLGG